MSNLFTTELSKFKSTTLSDKDKYIDKIEIYRLKSYLKSFIAY